MADKQKSSVLTSATPWQDCGMDTDDDDDNDDDGKVGMAEMSQTWAWALPWLAAWMNR
jgi:hypothetical protein